ncbi:hypothetical protein [Helcococcus sueciensis]|uniref:hypothetical protein n=1 Tax=Helcococcus sueciensis TaxID=241555 RepID=UPI0003F61BAD|nr:hypothetical protein [Helcococcus sueciensis]
MAEIVSIILRKFEDKWEIGVVRDDDYTEKKETDTEKYQDIIDEIVKIAETIKSEEQKLIENLENEKKEILKIITEKTPDEEKIELINSYPLWSPNGVEYWSDMEIPYVVYPDYETGSLYKVISKDKVKSQFDWNPQVAVSLFKKILPPNVIAEFGKNLDGSKRNLATNPYMINEKCIEDGYIYSSLIDNNVWAPSNYPTGWEKEREV